MITFMVTVLDDGKCRIDQLSAPMHGDPLSLVNSLRDPDFVTANISDGDRIDIHVKISEEVKRDVIVTLLDDTVPAFQTPEEAEEWMAARQAGRLTRYG